VLIPENHVITEEQRALIARLLLERISLRGICRAVGVGLQWLLQFTVERFQAAPEHLHVELPSSAPVVILQRLEAELDELWSFVGKKANRQWVRIALDAATRQVIAFHVGDRSGRSAQALWEKIPAAFQERATFYTDQYAVYTGVIPPPNIAPSPNSLVKRITSSASTARYDSGSLGWCVPRCRSRRT
jgi:IS1 family transposase